MTALCILFYTISFPISFQGYLGLDGLLDSGIYDGTGVGRFMAQMVGADAGGSDGKGRLA